MDRLIDLLINIDTVYTILQLQVTFKFIKLPHTFPEAAAPPKINF